MTPDYVQTKNSFFFKNLLTFTLGEFIFMVLKRAKIDKKPRLFMLVGGRSKR